jgi:hypothetical protein
MNSLPAWMYLTMVITFILTAGLVCLWHIQARAVVDAAKVQPAIITLLTEKAKAAAQVPQRWASSVPDGNGREREHAAHVAASD